MAHRHGRRRRHLRRVHGQGQRAFHTVSFPATILGSGEPWKLVDSLKGFNWLNYYGGKFSTSQQRGVFMDHALELLPADYWRWYLIAERAGESDDSQLHLGAVRGVGEQGPGRRPSATSSTGPSPKWAGISMIWFLPVESLVRKKLSYGHRSRSGSPNTSGTWTHWISARRQLRSSLCGQPETSISRPVSRGRPSRSTRTGLRAPCGQRSSCWCSAPWHRSPSSRQPPKRFVRVFPDLDWSTIRLGPELANLDLLAVGSRVESPGLLFKKLDQEQLDEWREQFGGSETEES